MTSQNTIIFVIFVVANIIFTVSVAGNWGRWSDWRPCSKTCNDGVSTRFRNCDNPPPAHGGKYCEGSSDGQKPCIVKRCRLGKQTFFSLFFF